MTAQAVIKLENANYERVILALERMLAANPKFCHCIRCRLDATAIALNSLPPRYFITPTSMDIDDLASSWLMVEVSILQAMERVSQYPHHVKEGHEEVKEDIKKIQEKPEEKELE